VTASARCGACRHANTEVARFCRHCGAPLGEAAVTDEAWPSSPPPEERGLFRELCVLCGVPLLVSITYVIAVRVAGPSALAEMLGTAAILVLSLLGTLGNGRLVAQALRLPRARDWGLTLALAVVTGPALSVAFWLLERSGVPMWSGYLVSYRNDGFPDWVGYVDIAVITPLSEELLYRGLVQPKLQQVLSTTEALIVQAALFSAAHLSPVILLTHFGMGLAFGWIRGRSGSLFPGILLHGAWNAWVIASSG
jgi:membrane protease YdiL (CAAX protease family)